jgi:Arc/MetJ family transcription regulator
MHALGMRTNIEIDDELMEAALRESGLRTKRAAVEEGLRLLIERHRRMKLIDAFGKYPWEGDLAEIRRWRSEKPG